MLERLRRWYRTSFNCLLGDHDRCRHSERFPGYACWCDCHFKV